MDISDNHICEPECIDEVLSKMPDLRVLYLQGNECVRKISNYRKTIIGKIKSIRYIDDKPVFDDERRFALAFLRGGYEEEKKDRARYREEQREKELKRLRDFEEFVHKGKKTEIEKPEVKESEEDKEKKKLDMLKRIKEKNKKKNEIFSEEDIGNLPHLKKEDAIGKENIEKKENDDEMPALEHVSEEERKNIKQENKKNEEICEIDTTMKHEDEDDKPREESKGGDTAFKVPIKDLDELD